MINLRQIGVACFILAASCIFYDGLSGLATSSTIGDIWGKISPTSLAAMVNLVHGISVTLWENTMKPLLQCWAFAFFSALGLMFIALDLVIDRKPSANPLVGRS